VNLEDAVVCLILKLVRFVCDRGNFEKKEKKKKKKN
jgi:hypothetical protein